jgi:hypothetical protein
MTSEATHARLRWPSLCLGLLIVRGGRIERLEELLEFAPRDFRHPASVNFGVQLAEEDEDLCSSVACWKSWSLSRSSWGIIPTSLGAGALGAILGQHGTRGQALALILRNCRKAS